MIRVLPDLEAVSMAAAGEVARAAADAVEARGRFTMALSGGHTPRRLYELFATGFRDRLPWDRTTLFWGDERCVPPDDPRSNYGLAATALLDALEPALDVHRIRGELGPDRAAAAYDAELARFFGTPAPPVDPDAGDAAFDLALLGLGRDGHTASLFPGGVDAGDGRWARPAVAPPDAPPAARVTLTLRAINASRRALFLVSGEEKRDALRRVRAIMDGVRSGDAGRGAESPPPAAMVRAVIGVLWLVDRAAAE